MNGKLAAMVLITVTTLSLTGISSAGEGYVYIDATYNSKYVWRGITFVDNSVLQPSIMIGSNELSLCAWGSIELTNENIYEGEDSTAGDFTEADIFLDYTNSIGLVTLSGGMMYCSYPNTGYRATTELYLVGSLGVPLSPTVSLYRDVVEVDGFYGILGVSHTFDGVLPSLGVMNPTITLSGSAGYGNSLHNGWYYGVDKAAPGAATFGAAFAFTLDDAIWLTPSINYSTLLDSEIREVFEPVNTENNTWLGVSLTWQPM